MKRGRSRALTAITSAITAILATALAATASPASASALDAPNDVALSAAPLRAGCSVLLHKAYRASAGADAFDVQLRWQCRGAAPMAIGSIAENGGGPKIVTVFYRHDEIVTLARWESRSPAADFQGDVYEVDAFRLVQAGGRTRFEPQRAVTRAFGDGLDGLLDGQRRRFPYKTAAAIRARLATLGL